MKFYIIVAALNPGVTIVDVQTILGVYATSYYRIAPNVWVVVSFLDAATLSASLNHLTTPGGTLLVSRIDPSDKQGMMVPDFWMWMRNHGGGP